MSATAGGHTGARFGTVEGDFRDGGDEKAADDAWADELIERARARTAGDTPGPVAGQAPPSPAAGTSQGIPDTPVAVPAAPAAPEEPLERRPPLVTFEDLHGSSGAFPALPAEQTPEAVPEFTQQVPAGPPAQNQPDPMRQVDLGIPGPAISIRKAAVEWGSVIVGALVMALLVKAYLFQAFYIPSPSMEPTLGNGDRIIVNKLSYRLHQVNRCDVVVFEAPPGAVNGVEDLIKRVIALPGETISAEAGRLRIDGGLLLEPYLVAQDLTSGFTLPPGCLNPSGTADTCLVPPGHVFVLGDNRTNSKDGRFFGPIPEDSILGRAFLRVWPLGDIGRL